MNVYKFLLYVTPEDIYNKLVPNQKEQLDKVVITSAQLGGDGYVRIECAALEKRIEITPKEPVYRQGLIGDEYIVAIEDSGYVTAIED